MQMAVNTELSASVDNTGESGQIKTTDSLNNK
jgi:hypothetical protein